LLYGIKPLSKGKLRLASHKDVLTKDKIVTVPAATGRQPSKDDLPKNYTIS
jgi:hypothetical protein